MKGIKFIVVTSLLAIATSASAQFSSSQGSSSSSSTDGWGSLWIEWNPSKFNIDSKGADDQSFTGLSIGYSQAFNVMSGKPLFVEAGLGVQYSFYTMDDDDDDYYYYSRMTRGGSSYDYYYYDDDEDPKFKMFSIKVPVNLLYKFDLPNSSVSLVPFIGANLRYNLTAKMSVGDKDYDYFDKNDMGSSKATWNRFQIGWNLGVKARFGQNFLVGVSYGSDFSEIAKKTKISTTTVSVGYSF